MSGLSSLDDFSGNRLPARSKTEVLATFVLISQNLIAKETERLTDLGLHTGLLTEHELTRVLQMLRAIQNKIGINNDAHSDLADADLEMETKPEDVLAEIERLQQREKEGRRLSPLFK
jgi:uncharacterized membrane protein